MKKSKDIYQEITNLFIEALEENIIPWQKPYHIKGSGLDEVYLPSFFNHRNGSTGKLYRSINTLILETVKLRKEFKSAYWLTFKQASDLDLKVRKGEKSTAIYYREPLYFKVVGDGKIKISASEYRRLRKLNTVKLLFIPLFKSYRVFNIDQIEGDFITPASPDQMKKRNTTFEGIEACEDLLESFKELPLVKHGNPAYYPSGDFITMPSIEEFISKEEYYSTFYHEAVHSTGHKSRLNRDGITKPIQKGSKEYSKEELVAEIGASFLCAETKIFLPEIEENSKAYIQSWIKVLKNDKNMIYYAASQAQKAIDFVLLDQSETVEIKTKETTQILETA